MTENWHEFADEIQKIWNANAAFWDDYMGEGNAFQLELVNPTVERLLALIKGEHVLEIACGNGSFSRRLAQAGAKVTAFDFSQVFIERARLRSQAYAGKIEYRVVDASDSEALLALGESRFDSAVCNMSLMDMVNIQPLLNSLPRLLKPNGRFVFSVMHPCFNSIGMTKMIEETDVEGELVTQYAVKVFRYLTPGAQKGLGVIGQPEPHYYFHRPISILLNTCFEAGFVLDRLEEPAFSESSQANRPFSWAQFHEIPPIMVARLRLP